jgi:phosphatidylglycerophosphatase A
VSRAVASFFGVGWLRPAPGTWGSLAALILSFAILEVAGLWLFLLGLALAIGAAFWSVSALVRQLGEPGHHDPSWVVIDEVAGQWIALLPIALGAELAGAAPTQLWPGWLAAFLLFRLFDIWKPGPVGWADRRPGAAGVVLDDLIAGALAALVVVLLAGLAHGALFL